MLGQLFNSKTRVKVLALFFKEKAKRFYIQQIVKLIKTDPANTHRELRKLADFGVLVSQRRANQKYYFLNKDSEYYKGLKELFKAYQEKEDGFFAMEEMPNYCPMIVANAWNTKRANDFFKKIGIKNRFSKLVTIYKNNICGLWALKNEFDGVAQEIIDKFISNPEWGDRYNQAVFKKQKQLFDETDKLSKINLGALSDRELLKLYYGYYSIYESVHIWHWVQTCVDFGENLFSKYLMAYLKDKIGNKKYSLGDVFAVLTTPTNESNPTKEHKDLLKILQYIVKHQKLKNYFKNTETRIIVSELKNKNAPLDKMLEKHAQKYGWLGYGTVGPNWDKNYFIDILASLVRQNAQPEKLLRNLEQYKKITFLKQKKYQKELTIDATHKRLFKIARGLVFTKGLRKDSMFHSYSVIENLFREIGRRFYLSVQQVRFCYPHEIKSLLLQGKFSAAKLNERYKFSVQYSFGKHYKDDILLEGKKAKDFLKTLRFFRVDIKDVKFLEGDCASSGQARGEVRIVNIKKDMQNMKKGNILVSGATNPDLVPAIKKSSAIVTDVGGITCHAAIISRELGIPCVIGTKIATKVLKNGDMVHVDATHGKVTIIKKAK